MLKRHNDLLEERKHSEAPRQLAVKKVREAEKVAVSVLQQASMKAANSMLRQASAEAAREAEQPAKESHAQSHDGHAPPGEAETESHHSESEQSPLSQPREKTWKRDLTAEPPAQEERPDSTEKEHSAAEESPPGPGPYEAEIQLQPENETTEPEEMGHLIDFL